MSDTAPSRSAPNAQRRQSVADLQKRLSGIAPGIEIVSYVVKMVSPSGGRLALSFNATSKDYSYAPWGKRVKPEVTP